MKAKASVVAQKLLNLYRQAHVIVGGWAAVNRVFVTEATQDVLAELKDLPTGKMLVSHIANLRNGTTPMDSIARELLPYGGMMVETAINVELSPDDLDDLISAINAFTPDQAGLDKFTALPIIQQFGPEWITSVKHAIANNRDAIEKFDKIVKTWTAYNMWQNASEIVRHPLNDRIRAQLQVDMPEYETYLPLFGADGKKLLKRLHGFVRALPTDTSN